MKIFINSKEFIFKQDNTSLQDILAKLNLVNKTIAIEVNGQVIPRSQHSYYKVSNNDKLEVIEAIGGG